MAVELKSLQPTGGSGDGDSETLDGSTGTAAFYTPQILNVIPSNKSDEEVQLGCDKRNEDLVRTRGRT